MKLFFCYCKERRLWLGTVILCVLLFSLFFLLYRLALAAVLYPLFLCFFIAAVVVGLDFCRMRRKHRLLEGLCRSEDILLADLPPAEGVIEEDYKKLSELLKEEYAATRQEGEEGYDDRLSYYTAWVHQIKTPIAAMRLQLQNEDSPLSRQLSPELFRIEQYVEMVMAFLRLDAEHMDYVIRECDVDAVVKQVVKKFAGEFIRRRLTLTYEPLELQAVTDEKWLAFVVEQILSNALKYTPKGGISITAQRGVLCIRDTGIGIEKGDLPRIFENGYTGRNGRLDKRASGIGLYLCKRTCDRLGHRLWAESVLAKGTVVYLDLSRYEMEFE